MRLLGIVRAERSQRSRFDYHQTGVTGKISTNVNASVQINQPIRTPAQQTMYSDRELLDFTNPKQVEGTVVVLLLQPDETRYDNIKNYFQTGLYQKYDINCERW